MQWSYPRWEKCFLKVKIERKILLHTEKRLWNESQFLWNSSQTHKCDFWPPPAWFWKVVQKQLVVHIWSSDSFDQRTKLPQMCAATAFCFWRRIFLFTCRGIQRRCVWGCQLRHPKHWLQIRRHVPHLRIRGNTVQREGSFVPCIFFVVTSALSVCGWSHRSTIPRAGCVLIK